MDFILDHYENPRNAGTIEDADVEKGRCDIAQNGGNPGCGDIITICLKVEDGIIKDFKFVRFFQDNMSKSTYPTPPKGRQSMTALHLC